MPFKKGNKYKFEKECVPWNKGKDLKDYPQMGFKKGHKSFSEKGRFTKGHIPKHSKINKKELIELYSCKKSIKEISGYFGCRETTVYQYLQNHNIKLREYPNGEKHHCWKGGKSFEPYDKRFNNIFKRRIRKRDNQVCMLCSIHREKLNKSLTVHHVNYDKKLSIPQNCLSLCNSCHTKTNFNREHWIKFFQSLLSKKYDYKYSENEIILEVSA